MLGFRNKSHFSGYCFTSMCRILLTFHSLLWELFWVCFRDDGWKQEEEFTGVTSCPFCPLQTVMNPLHAHPQDQVYILMPPRLVDVFGQDYGKGLTQLQQQHHFIV